MTSSPHSSDPSASVQTANCPTHGDFEQRVMTTPETLGAIVFRSPCPKCAQARREAEARIAAEQERTKRENLTRQLFERSQMPPRFRTARFENYEAASPDQKRALTIAQKMAECDEPGASLIFCGRPGTGKTHLACAIGAGFIEAGASVLFKTALSAVRYIKDTYRKESPRTETQAIEDLCKPALLILDEIGVQVGSEHEKMLVFEVINERYQRMSSTILISNLSREELSEYLGERIIDRFREDGAVVAFNWASHRGRRS